MKPKDFDWTRNDTGKPYLHRGMFVLHPFAEETGFPIPCCRFFSEVLAPGASKISIEFCSGNGSWIAQKAGQSSGEYWIGVERKLSRARKIWSKTQNGNLSNLLPVWGEASLFAERYLPDASIDAIYINFPDPWPKKRHAKYRLIQSPFVRLLARIAKPEAIATIVTDSTGYSDQIIQEMEGDEWKSEHAFPHFISHYPGYGDSYFESLWRSRGLEIRYHLFRRQY